MKTTMSHSIVFDVYTHAYNWGPANDGIVLYFPAVIQLLDWHLIKLSASKVCTTFNQQSQQFEKVTVTEEVKILDGYCVNEALEPCLASSAFYLKLEVGPAIAVANPFDYDLSIGFNVNQEIAYHFNFEDGVVCGQQTYGAFEVDASHRRATICEEMKDYQHFKYQYLGDQPISLQYSLYTPPVTGLKRPLIILLHGAGEGGTDPKVALYGNKVTALSQTPIQDYFEQAYVLVPQAPTMWMDCGDNTYTSDGKSIYTEGLIALIQSVLKTHDGIDLERIYLGGGSNGGYMTLRLLIDEPNMFAGAFAICMAFKSSWVTDEDLHKIAKTPLWLVHSHDDPVVAFGETALPIYQRLKGIGMSEVYLSEFDQVVDNHYLDASTGEPYRYNGHLSWIYVYNDQIHDRETSLFSWLSKQSKP